MSRLVDHDVIVVGAGAAGLGAARALADAGASFIVLEARGRLGGRAFTDHETFGVPFDRGCHWLHSASQNPFVAIADRLGFAYDRDATNRARELVVDGIRAAPAERDRVLEEIRAAFAVADRAGEEGRDIAAGVLLDRTSPNFPLIEHWYGLMSAMHPDEISTLDLARYRDMREDWPVVDGYGALVAACGAGLPVELLKPVDCIDTTGSSVLVSGSWGKLSAGAVVLTAPSSVLAGGAVRFRPGLPARMCDALAACPTGAAEKVALLFEDGLPDLEPTSYADVFRPGEPGRSPVSFLVRPYGRPLMIAHLGGRFARDLERAGEAAMIEFVRDAVREGFGSGIAGRVAKVSATHWTSDRYALGAYSSMLPGKADLRRILAEPIGDRVFLAGEAVSSDAFSTAHGAWLCGVATAARALGSHPAGCDRLNY